MDSAVVRMIPDCAKDDYHLDRVRYMKTPDPFEDDGNHYYYYYCPDVSSSNWVYNQQGILLDQFLPIANGWCEDSEENLHIYITCNLLEQQNLRKGPLFRCSTGDIVEDIRVPKGKKPAKHIIQFLRKKHPHHLRGCLMLLDTKGKILWKEADMPDEDDAIFEQRLVDHLIATVKDYGKRDGTNVTLSTRDAKMKYFYDKDKRYKEFIERWGGLASFCGSNYRVKDVIQFRRRQGADELVLVDKGKGNQFQQAQCVSNLLTQDNKYAYGDAQEYGGTEDEVDPNMLKWSAKVPVKNTFIHVDVADTTEMTPARRRSLSVPCHREHKAASLHVQLV